jgi:transcriptional regulator with XRE-family HTH domain
MMTERFHEPNWAGFARELKRARTERGLSVRDVEAVSTRIAETEKNRQYFISHARLVQIEGGRTVPGLHKLVTLSIIYDQRLPDLIRMLADYSGVEARNDGDRASRATHMLGSHYAGGPVPEVPSFQAETALVKNENAEPGKTWAVIGAEDNMMHPLLRSGAAVQIDTRLRAVSHKCASEYERHIYLLELRTGYLCCWCEIRGDRLFAIPHPSSGKPLLDLAYPRDVDVVGRVVRIFMRLGPHGPARRAAGSEIGERTMAASV